MAAEHSWECSAAGKRNCLFTISLSNVNKQSLPVVGEHPLAPCVMKPDAIACMLEEACILSFSLSISHSGKQLEQGGMVVFAIRGCSSPQARANM